MTDYTIITENFGDTICQEFLEKTKEKFKQYPLAPRKNENIYGIGINYYIPINLMDILTEKINSYFSYQE